VLNPTAVSGLLSGHSGGRQSNDRRIFAMLVFQRWMMRMMACWGTWAACAS
jgi:hypothetical protein